MTPKREAFAAAATMVTSHLPSCSIQFCAVHAAMIQTIANPRQERSYQQLGSSLHVGGDHRAQRHQLLATHLGI